MGKESVRRINAISAMRKRRETRKIYWNSIVVFFTRLKVGNTHWRCIHLRRACAIAEDEPRAIGISENLQRSVPRTRAPLSVFQRVG
jgi:hypothetical protein